MLENLDIKDTINIIFDNPRISDGIKFKLIKRKEALDKVCNQYNLFDYVLGQNSFEEVEKLIPEGIIIPIYDLRYNSKEFKDYLRDFELKDIKDKIEDNIKIAVKDLISDYNEELSFYNKFISQDQHDLSKVWINALSILFLIKWLIYTNEINKESEIHEKIELGLDWLKDNCNWKDENLFLYSTKCENYDSFLYPVKIYETSLALQVLLRTYNYKSFKLDNINFTPTVDIILNLKETNPKDDRTLTWWPSDITVNARDIKDVKNKVYDGDVGATSHVIQLLSEIVKNNMLKEHEQSIKKEIINGVFWLINQRVDNGSWCSTKDFFSIEQSCDAIQAILKFDSLYRSGGFNKIEVLDKNKEQQIKDTITKGLEWLSEQFCIEEGDLLIYAWPEDKRISTDTPCCKNTALALSTFLKAGVNPNSFLIVKPIMWLFKEKPKHKFDNIYKYCAMIDYLGSFVKKLKSI